jgi:hypothetical protein
MMVSEEEMIECLQSVSGPPSPEPQPVFPDLYPHQCDQKLLKEVIRQAVKNPQWRDRKEVKCVLDKIKSKKKIHKGNECLRSVLELK